MTARHDPSLSRRFLLTVGAAAAAAMSAPSLAKAAEAGPIRVAVFPFELADHSGGSGIVGQDALDTRYLKEATAEARRLLAASGRYHVLDTAAVAGDSGAAGGFLDCNGCEAGLARRVGADQSMVGAVTRVTRVEYTLQIVMRDARTGKIVSNHFTGLRMGANYSWPRAVKWLMDNRILAARQER